MEQKGSGGHNRKEYHITLDMAKELHMVAERIYPGVSSVAAEVEKYFETKVNPGTIFQQARRKQADTNVSPKEKQTIPSGSGGNNGNKSTLQEAAEIMSKEVDKGKSSRDAAPHRGHSRYGMHSLG